MLQIAEVATVTCSPPRRRRRPRPPPPTTPPTLAAMPSLSILSDDVIRHILKQLASLEQVDLRLDDLQAATQVCRLWKRSLMQIHAALTPADWEATCRMLPAWVMPNPLPAPAAAVQPPAGNAWATRHDYIGWGWFRHEWIRDRANAQLGMNTRGRGDMRTFRRLATFNHLTSERPSKHGRVGGPEWACLLCRVPLDLCCLTLVTIHMLERRHAEGSSDSEWFGDVIRWLPVRRASEVLYELTRRGEDFDVRHGDLFIRCDRWRRHRGYYGDEEEYCDCDECNDDASAGDVIHHFMDSDQIASIVADWSVDHKLELWEQWSYEPATCGNGSRRDIGFGEAVAMLSKMCPKDETLLELLPRLFEIRFSSRRLSLTVDDEAMQTFPAEHRVRWMRLLARLSPEALAGVISNVRTFAKEFAYTKQIYTWGTHDHYRAAYRAPINWHRGLFQSLPAPCVEKALLAWLRAEIPPEGLKRVSLTPNGLNDVTFAPSKLLKCHLKTRREAALAIEMLVFSLVNPALTPLEHLLALLSGSHGLRDATLLLVLVFNEDFRGQDDEHQRVDFDFKVPRPAKLPGLLIAAAKRMGAEWTATLLIEALKLKLDGTSVATEPDSFLKGEEPERYKPKKVWSVDRGDSTALVCHDGLSTLRSFLHALHDSAHCGDLLRRLGESVVRELLGDTVADSADLDLPFELSFADVLLHGGPSSEWARGVFSRMSARARVHFVERIRRGQGETSPTRGLREAHQPYSEEAAAQWLSCDNDDDRFDVLLRILDFRPGITRPSTINNAFGARIITHWPNGTLGAAFCTTSTRPRDAETCAYILCARPMRPSSEQSPRPHVLSASRCSTELMHMCAACAAHIMRAVSTKDASRCHAIIAELPEGVRRRLRTAECQSVSRFWGVPLAVPDGITRLICGHDTVKLRDPLPPSPPPPPPLPE